MVLQGLVQSLEVPYGPVPSCTIPYSPANPNNKATLRTLRINARGQKHQNIFYATAGGGIILKIFCRILFNRKLSAIAGVSAKLKFTVSSIYTNL